MTVSRQNRSENINKAIQTLMSELGEDSIIMTIFRRPGPEYDGILPTTWDDLEESGWIVTQSTTMGNEVRFRLTGTGWIEGLRRTGRFDATVAKLPQLCRAAKGRLKGREQDEHCDIGELARGSHLPRSFVENVVESALLQSQFPEKKMELRWWSSGSLRQFVRIPRSFGMERL